jgi:hypothetical protein
MVSVLMHVVGLSDIGARIEAGVEEKVNATLQQMTWMSEDGKRQYFIKRFCCFVAHDIDTRRVAKEGMRVALDGACIWYYQGPQDDELTRMNRLADEACARVLLDVMKNVAVDREASPARVMTISFRPLGESRSAEIAAFYRDRRARARINGLLWGIGLSTAALLGFQAVRHGVRNAL